MIVFINFYSHRGKQLNVRALNAVSWAKYHAIEQVVVVGRYVAATARTNEKKQNLIEMLDAEPVLSGANTKSAIGIAAVRIIENGAHTITAKMCLFYFSCIKFKMEART